MAYLAGKLTCSGLHKTEGESSTLLTHVKLKSGRQESEHTGQLRELHCRVFLLHRYPRVQAVGESTRGKEGRAVAESGGAGRRCPGS